MSYRKNENGHMKNLLKKKETQASVTFGTVRLVRLQNGTMMLSPGRRSDELEAREWISLFMHEAVPRHGKTLSES